MPTTDIAICSRALIQLGADTINSFNDEKDVAKICANIYPPLRRAIISKHPWRCMMAKMELQLAAAPPVGEWAKAYLLPGSMIGLPRAAFDHPSSKTPRSDYEVFGRFLYCDWDRCLIDFVQEKPEAEWPAFFEQLMVECLCAQIGFAVTDQQSVSEFWNVKAYGTPSEGGFGGAMGEALTLDAQSSGNIGFDSSVFVDARFGGVW
jgi:hypothetical protein